MNDVSHQVAVDFPWMASLPAEQKSRLAELWAEFGRREPEPGCGILLRPREACELLGLARHQILLMVNRGRFASFRRGSARLIPLDALRTFARSWKGKRRWQMGRAWSPPEEALLGTMSDTEVAAQLGRTYQDVRWRRLRLGKGPLPRPGPPRHVFTPEEDALLGTVPDRWLAARLGHSKTIVLTRRKQLGVCAFGVRRRMIREWTAAEDALLGTLPDAQLARKLVRPLIDVRARRSKLSVASFAGEKTKSEFPP